MKTMKILYLLMICMIATGVARGAENTGTYTFVDCSEVELFHLTFRDQAGNEIDFGPAGKNNQLSGVPLCVGPYKDQPNPQFIGKPFRIKWHMQEAEVYLDPPNWDKIGWRPVPTILSIQAIASAPIAREPLSHCSSQEETLFTCKISKSKKLVSICTSKGFSNHSGYIQYRFGRPNQVELAFPKVISDSSRKFLWQTYGYSGGWDTRIQFSIENFRYQVYDKAYKKTASSKDLYGGILVYKKNKKLAELKCDLKTISGGLNQLYGKIPSGNFFVDTE